MADKARPSRSLKQAESSKQAKEIAAYLCSRDKKLAQLIETVGEYKLPVNALQSTYEALAESIIYQQITGKAAASIFNKVVEQLGQGRAGQKTFPKAESLLKRSPEELRACGLSGAKQRALLDLAARTCAGAVPDIDEMNILSDEELIEKLVTIRGIGTWTVQMLLIFRLGRPDVMPHTDYGIRKGFTRTFPRHGKKAKDGLVSPASVLARAELWRPYRTCASWYLWRATEL